MVKNEPCSNIVKTMNHRTQKQANFRSVNTYFDRVAKLDYVKDKWISLDPIIQLIRRECSRNEEILNLSDSQIKSYITKLDQLSHNNSINVFTHIRGFLCCLLCCFLLLFWVGFFFLFACLLMFFDRLLFLRK